MLAGRYITNARNRPERLPDRDFSTGSFAVERPIRGRLADDDAAENGAQLVFELDHTDAPMAPSSGCFKRGISARAKSVTLRTGIVVDRIPEYELFGAEVIRALDATEHNMERLNARARGSGRAYFTVRVEGPLAHDAFERALDALASRHPLCRVRIVRNAEGALFFAPTRGDRKDGTAKVPVSYLRVDDLASWPDLVEADMNAGPIASERGPLFAFAVIEPTRLAEGASGERIVVLVGHHAVCDATSLVALLHELLGELARPGLLKTLFERPLSDPFCLDVPVPELTALETEVRNAVGDPDAERRRQRLASAEERLERLELDLGAKKDAEQRFPRALKSLHALLSLVSSERTPAAGVLPEVELGTGAARYERAGTALVHGSLSQEQTRAIRRMAKEHGLTLHAVLSAAQLMAQAARDAELREQEGAVAASPPAFALASAVSLRKQFAPALEPHDLRMAIDVVIPRIPLAPGERFWQIARRAGEEVTRAVGSARALSSFFRTEPRDFEVSPPGVRFPMISNLGLVALEKEYGPLRVRELCGAMATHGSFQIIMLVLTFDDRLIANFYCETPSVSRASLERLALRTFETLDAVGQGGDPAFGTPLP